MPALLELSFSKADYSLLQQNEELQQPWRAEVLFSQEHQPHIPSECKVCVHAAASEAT